MADITDNFENVESCGSSSLAEKVIQYLIGKDKNIAKEILDNICNVLLLATGKTDNNLKCQFPLMLNKQLHITTYPQKMRNGRWVDKDIPRTLTVEDVTKLIVQLEEQINYRKVFIESYFHLIVSDAQYAKQLWSLGNAYAAMVASVSPS